MKINDKHLGYYGSCTEPPDKEGWLWKKGELNTSYQKRWCVLRGNLFFYFEKRYDREPVGVIVLENSSVQLAEGGDSAFTFSIHFPGEGTRTYKLTADTDETCTSWIKALSSCSYRYLEILVDCLEREIEMLKSTKNIFSKKSAPTLSHAHEGDSHVKSKTQSIATVHANTFGTLSTKCNSMDNMINFNESDSFSDKDEDFLTFANSSTTNLKSSNDLNRSRSSGELGNLQVAHSGLLQPPSPKSKGSVMKKLSPRLKKKKNGQDKSSKDNMGITYHVNHLDIEDKKTSLISFKFLEMHAKFRDDIIAYLSS